MVVTESLVILEFLADAFPAAGILPPPSDAAARARVRGFVAFFEARFVPAFVASFYRGAPAQGVLDALAAVQARMVSDSESTGAYACGAEWSMADMAAAPFLLRALMMFEGDVGKYPEGEGKAAFAAFNNDPKYSRMARYFAAIKAHPTVQATWDEVGGCLRVQGSR